MAAPFVLDNDTVSSFHQALGLNDIVNSISHLSSLVKSTLKRKSSDKEESSKKRFRPDDNVAFEQQHESSDDGNGSEEESHSGDDDDVSRFGNAFSKDKTAANVNSSLASMLNQACTTPADVAFIKDIRDKYNRPNNIPHLLVPSVNATIYRKMSCFQKDMDHGLQKTQGNLCGGIYATASLSDRLFKLRKDNPDDELLTELHSMTEDALFLLSHSSFQLSVARRDSLKHLFAGDYKDLCKKTQNVTDELFGSELTKVCKDISETSRATSKMLKSSSVFNKNSRSNSFRDTNSFRPSRKQSSNSKSYSKNYQGHRWNPNYRNPSNKSSSAKNNKPQ
jgi:hypothetical protein